MVNDNNIIKIEMMFLNDSTFFFATPVFLNIQMCLYENVTARNDKEIKSDDVCLEQTCRFYKDHG